MNRIIPSSKDGQQKILLTKSNTIFAPSWYDKMRYEILTKEVNKKFTFNYSWWEKGRSPYYYPFLLVSAFYAYKDFDFREIYHLDKDCLLIVDSGGYQIMTRNKPLSTHRIIKFQEKNADIAMIRDYPIKPDVTSVECLQHQEKSIESAKEFLEIRTNNKMLLYNVYFGRNYKELQQFRNLYKNIENDFEGSSLGSLVPLSRNPIEITMILISWLEAIERRNNLHIFGLTGFNTLPIIYYISKKYSLKNLTFDSTTYNIGCTSNSYILPFDMRKKLNFGNLANQIHKLKELPCLCPVCTRLNIDEMTKIREKGKQSINGALINLHNLFIYIDFTHTLSSLVDDENYFKKFVETNCDKKVMDSLNIIDYVVENGFDKFKDKYIQRHNLDLSDFS
jgi:tRNA-guanine family transglycosylase